MRLVLAGASLGLAVLLGGCTSIKDHRGYLVDQTLLDSVQPGVDNRTSVERTLGRPTFVSQFGSKDWYYVSMDTKRPAFQQPRTYQQTVLRVRFDEAGNVASVQRSGLEQVASINPTNDETPTLGRNRGFFEELFGNIGQVGSVGGAGRTTDNPQ